MASSPTRNKVIKGYGVEQFGENGFAGPISVLSSQETESALEAVNREFGLSDDHGTTTKISNNAKHLQANNRFKVHLYMPEINRIVRRPTLLNAVRKALNTSHVVLWSSDLNIKLPQTKNFFSAHQDATYSGLEPADQCLTAWIALSDPVGIPEGCMSFLRRSHTLGQLPHEEDIHQQGNMLSRGQRVCIPTKNNDNDDVNTTTNGPEETNEWVAIPLRGGQATFHHFHTIHQSGANQHPTLPRIGLALRYMAVGVRQTGPVRESVTLIGSNGNSTARRASDSDSDNEAKRKEVEQWFDLEPQLPDNPSSEDIAAGHRAHEDAMKREASNYFQDSTHVKAYDEHIRNS